MTICKWLLVDKTYCNKEVVSIVPEGWGKKFCKDHKKKADNLRILYDKIKLDTK